MWEGLVASAEPNSTRSCLQSLKRTALRVAQLQIWRCCDLLALRKGGHAANDVCFTPLSDIPAAWYRRLTTHRCYEVFGIVEHGDVAEPPH
jgi:hypothetical protein